MSAKSNCEKVTYYIKLLDNSKGFQAGGRTKFEWYAFIEFVPAP